MMDACIAGRDGRVISPRARPPALPARFLRGSCLAPSPARSVSAEMLLINGLFSDGDLHHTFCTPRWSGRGGITIISGQTPVPSVFPGASVPWEVTKVEDQVFSPPLFSTSLSRKKWWVLKHSAASFPSQVTHTGVTPTFPQHDLRHFFPVVWQNPYVPGSDHLSLAILLHKSFWCISLLIDFFL